MGTRRTPLVICVIGTLWLGACGSDDDSGSDSTPGTADIASITTTTIAGSAATIATVLPSAATVTTAVAAPTTVIVTTTVVGRVVTSPSDNVKVGDSGDGVKQIQTALKAQGYEVTVDGKFGNQTATAVKSFQKKNGLKQDGIVGPKTWAKLSASGSSGATTTTKA